MIVRRATVRILTSLLYIVAPLDFALATTDSDATIPDTVERGTVLTITGTNTTAPSVFLATDVECSPDLSLASALTDDDGSFVLNLEIAVDAPLGPLDFAVCQPSFVTVSPAIELSTTVVNVAPTGAIGRVESGSDDAFRAINLDDRDGEVTTLQWSLLDDSGAEIGTGVGVEFAPGDLEPGDYRLVLTILDNDSGVGQQSIPLNVAPVATDPPVAATTTTTTATTTTTSSSTSPPTTPPPPTTTTDTGGGGGDTDVHWVTVVLIFVASVLGYALVGLIIWRLIRRARRDNAVESDPAPRTTCQVTMSDADVELDPLHPPAFSIDTHFDTERTDVHMVLVGDPDER